MTILRFAGSPLEFERLLMNKTIFTILTLVLVIATWVLKGVCQYYKHTEHTRC